MPPPPHCSRSEHPRFANSPSQSPVIADEVIGCVADCAVLADRVAVVAADAAAVVRLDLTFFAPWDELLEHVGRARERAKLAAVALLQSTVTRRTCTARIVPVREVAASFLVSNSMASPCQWKNSRVPPSNQRFVRFARTRCVVSPTGIRRRSLPRSRTDPRAELLAPLRAPVRNLEKPTQQVPSRALGRKHDVVRRCDVTADADRALVHQDQDHRRGAMEDGEAALCDRRACRHRHRMQHVGAGG